MLIKKTLYTIALIVSSYGISLQGMASYNRDIWHASRMGDIARIMELVTAGADINQQDSEGRTPLHIAVLLNHQEIVKALIAKGAYIDPQDHSGSTPLHRAIANGYQEIAKTLVLAGANLTVTDSRNLSPQRHTILIGYPTLFELSRWAKSTQAQQRTPETPYQS